MEWPPIFQQFNSWLLTAISSGQGFWIYAVLTLAVMVEGPFAILLASSLASAEVLQPVYVFLSASIGNLFGDTLWYSLGYFSRFDWIARLQRLIKAEPDKLAALASVMRDQAVKILLIAKLTNGLMVPALITTGLLKVPFRKWFPYIFVANAAVTGVFVALGYYLTANLMKAQEGIRYAAAAASLMMFFALTWFFRRTLQKKFINKTFPGAVEINPADGQQE